MLTVVGRVTDDRAVERCEGLVSLTLHTGLRRPLDVSYWGGLRELITPEMSVAVDILGAWPAGMKSRRTSSSRL